MSLTTPSFPQPSLPSPHSLGQTCIESIYTGAANAITIVSKKNLFECHREIITTIQDANIDDLQHFTDISKDCSLSTKLNSILKRLKTNGYQTIDIIISLNTKEFKDALYQCCYHHLINQAGKDQADVCKVKSLQTTILKYLLCILKQLDILGQTHRPIIGPSGPIYPQPPHHVAKSAKRVTTPHPALTTPKLNIQLLIRQMDLHYLSLHRSQREQTASKATQKQELSRATILDFTRYSIIFNTILGFKREEIQQACQPYRNLSHSFHFACELLKTSKPVTLFDLMPSSEIRACVKMIQDHHVPSDENIHTLFHLIHVAATMLCLQSFSFKADDPSTTPKLDEKKTMSNLKTDLLSWFTKNIPINPSKLMIKPYIDCYILAISKGDVNFILSLSEDDLSLAKLDETILQLVKTPSFGWNQLYTALNHRSFPSKQRPSYQANERSLVQEVIQIQLNHCVKPAYEKLAKKWQSSMSPKCLSGHQENRVPWNMFLLLRQLYETIIKTSYEKMSQDDWKPIISNVIVQIGRLPETAKGEVYLSARGLVNWLKVYLPNISNQSKLEILEDKSSNIEFEVFGLYALVVLGDTKGLLTRLKSASEFETVLYNSSFGKRVVSLCIPRCFGYTHNNANIKTRSYLRKQLSLGVGS